MINIEGLDKATVLAALYNASRPQGMGFLHYNPKPMTTDEAEQLLAHTTSFDYLKGRVMKIDLKSGAEFEARWYDRDNGTNTAAMVIESLRQQAPPNNAVTQLIHDVGKFDAALSVRQSLNQPTVLEDGMLTLGAADAADVLGPAVDAALSFMENDQ